MEIVINVVKAPTGRLAGTVQAPGAHADFVSFSGTLELLAAIERICACDDQAETS
jgi:hypothetical protein